MFKVDEDKKEIHITRGDKCAITLTLTNGSFNAGDTIYFRAYERKKLNELPVISKEFNITEDCDSFDIELTAEDTKIGEYANRKIEYWYEIELNDGQTLIGYDENGAKILWLYPEGVEENGG